MSQIGNQFKTVALLALLTALLLWVGQLLGGTQGLYIALVIVFIMNFGSYWFSDKIVLECTELNRLRRAKLTNSMI